MLAEPGAPRRFLTLTRESTEMTNPDTTASALHERKHAWTPDAVRALGMTTDVQTAGAILGIGRSKSYELAKTGQFPVKLIHIGRRYAVSVDALLKLLQTT